MCFLFTFNVQTNKMLPENEHLISWGSEQQQWQTTSYFVKTIVTWQIKDVDRQKIYMLSIISTNFWSMCIEYWSKGSWSKKAPKVDLIYDLNKQECVFVPLFSFFNAKLGFFHFPTVHRAVRAVWVLSSPH